MVHCLLRELLDILFGHLARLAREKTKKKTKKNIKTKYHPLHPVGHFLKNDSFVTFPSFAAKKKIDHFAAMGHFNGQKKNSGHFSPMGPFQNQSSSPGRLEDENWIFTLGKEYGCMTSIL